MHLFCKMLNNTKKKIREKSSPRLRTLNSGLPMFRNLIRWVPHVKPRPQPPCDFLVISQMLPMKLEKRERGRHDHEAVLTTNFNRHFCVQLTIQEARKKKSLTIFFVSTVKFPYYFEAIYDFFFFVFSDLNWSKHERKVFFFSVYEIFVAHVAFGCLLKKFFCQWSRRETVLSRF